MDKHNLQQAREQHEKYFARMEEDLGLAETMARLGLYEDALNLYDFFLERYGRDGRLLWDLSECLKLYRDNLIENENTKRARELEEKYAPMLSEINVSPL